MHVRQIRFHILFTFSNYILGTFNANAIAVNNKVRVMKIINSIDMKNDTGLHRRAWLATMFVCRRCTSASFSKLDIDLISRKDAPNYVLVAMKHNLVNLVWAGGEPWHILQLLWIPLNHWWSKCDYYYYVILSIGSIEIFQSIHISLALNRIFIAFSSIFVWIWMCDIRQSRAILILLSIF